MRRSTVIGLVSGFGLIAGAILLGNTYAKFLDPASLLLVLGGTGAALAVSYSFDDLRKAIRGTKRIFTFRQPSFQRHIDQLSNLARMARREGILALDRQIDEIDNELLQFGLERAVDGMDASEIKEMMDERIKERARQRRIVSQFYSTAGTYAPAFGMIGTLVGLIQMLNNLNDPTQIGAGMATALVTTFYGALTANLVFLPLGDRAKAQSKTKAKLHYVIREGILAIARGDSPRMIEQRLGFLAKQDPDEVEAAASVQGTPEGQPAAATA